MRSVLALILTAALLCGILTGCASGSATPEESSGPLSTGDVSIDDFSDASDPIFMDPELPIETIPQKPDADFEIPPAPTNEPVSQ